jgi:hypothetical protein
VILEREDPASAWGGRRHLTRGPAASVTRREGRRRARSRELARPEAGFAGLGPRRGNGEAKTAARGWEGWAAGPKAEKRNKTPFLFPFQLFQSIFKLF